MIKRAAIMLATLLALTACGGGGDPLARPTGDQDGGGKTITIGSANFPGNVLLASIYSQGLQAKGVQVEEKFNVGAREVLYDQIQSGGLTVLPEYNGALLNVSVDPDATATTTEDVNKALEEKLPDSLEILDSSPAEDKDTLSVTKATATKDGLKTMDDLKKVASGFTVGGPEEFQKRREKQFQKVYGLKFKGWEATGDTTADALKDDKIQAGNVFSADPKILQYDLVPLEDTKNVFAAQNVTPLVNKEGVDDTAKVALNAISAKLTTDSLVGMMEKIAVDKEDPPDVAKDWLTQNGLG